MRKLAILVLLGLLVACGTNKDNSEPPALLTSIENAIPIAVNWKVDTRASDNRAAHRLRPMISGDRLYSIDNSGLVRSIDLNNGRRLWRHQSGFIPIVGPGGNAQMLILTSRDGEVAAFREVDNEKLELRWKIRIGSEITGDTGYRRCPDIRAQC